MPLDAVELEWIKRVGKVKSEERKSIKERLAQHLVQSGRAAEPSTLDAKTATPNQVRNDAAAREKERARREDELQNIVQDKAEIGANAVHAEAGATILPNAYGGGAVGAARRAIRTKAANKLAKKRAKLDVSDPTLRARAEKEVKTAQPTLIDKPLQDAIDEQARKHLDIRRDKMIADQLNVKLGRPAYVPYAPDGTLTNVAMDPALKRAVDERKTQIEIDNAVSREIEKQIAVQAPETDHPYTRNEKIDKIVIDVAAKYGVTNLAHLIGRHGAKRTNPATGKVDRTNDDMVSRLVTGVGSDKKDAVLAGGGAKSPGQTVTANLAGTGGPGSSAASVTVPDYGRVGQETGPSSSQHASAKAALFMMEAAAAEAARLERQVGADVLGREDSVEIAMGTENVGGEARGAYSESGKLGKSYSIPSGLKLQKNDRGHALATYDIRNRIRNTTVTGNNPSAVATLVPDKIHGGVNLMTMFTKQEALSGGSQLMRRVGQNNVAQATRSDPAANRARAQKAATAAQDVVTKLTRLGGPQKTAETQASLAETARASDENAAKAAIAKLPPEKQALAKEAQAAAVEAEQAKRDSDEQKSYLDKAEALAKAAEEAHYGQAIPAAMAAFEKAKDAVPLAENELATATSELEAAVNALTTDPTNVNKRSLKEQKEAKAAEARVKVQQAKADYELVCNDAVNLAKDEAALDQTRELLARRQEEYKQAAARADELAKKRDEATAQFSDGVPANDAAGVKGALTALAGSTAVAETRKTKLEEVNRAVESAQGQLKEANDALAVVNAVGTGPAAAVSQANIQPLAPAATPAVRLAAAKGADEAIAEVNALIAGRASSAPAATAAVNAARAAAIQAAGAAAAAPTATAATVQAAARAAAYKAAKAAAQQAHDNQVAVEAKAKLSADLTAELQAKTGDKPGDARARLDKKAAEQQAAIEKNREEAAAAAKARQTVVEEVKKDSQAKEGEAKQSAEELAAAHEKVQALKAKPVRAAKRLKQAEAKHQERQKQWNEVEATLASDRTAVAKEKLDAAEKLCEELAKGPGEQTRALTAEAENLQKEIAKLEEDLPKQQEKLKAVEEKSKKVKAEWEQVENGLKAKEMNSVPTNQTTINKKRKAAEEIRVEAAALEKQVAELKQSAAGKGDDVELLTKEVNRKRTEIEELKKTETEENAVQVQAEVKSATSELTQAEEKVKKLAAEQTEFTEQAEAKAKQHEEKNKALQAADKDLATIEKKKDLTIRLDILKSDFTNATRDIRDLKKDIETAANALPEKREAKQLKEMQASISRSSEQRVADQKFQAAAHENESAQVTRQAAEKSREGLQKLVEESDKELQAAQAVKAESDLKDAPALAKAQEDMNAARAKSRQDRRAALEARRVAEQLEAEQTNRQELDGAQVEQADAEHDLRAAQVGAPTGAPVDVRVQTQMDARKAHADAQLKHAEAAAERRRAEVKLHAAEAQRNQIGTALAKAEEKVQDVREKQKATPLAALTPNETKALARVTKLKASRQKADQKVTTRENERQTCAQADGVAAAQKAQAKAQLKQATAVVAKLRHEEAKAEAQLKQTAAEDAKVKQGEAKADREKGEVSLHDAENLRDSVAEGLRQAEQRVEEIRQMQTQDATADLTGVLAKALEQAADLKDRKEKADQKAADLEKGRQALVAAEAKAEARKDHADAQFKYAEAVASRRQAEVNLHDAEDERDKLAADLKKAEEDAQVIREKQKLDPNLILTNEETLALDLPADIQGRKEKADQKVTNLENDLQARVSAEGVASTQMEQKKAALDDLT